MTAEEQTFVMSSFATNYRRHSGLSSNVVYERLVLHPFEAVLPALDVRVEKVTADDFIGWSASHGSTLFYLYVKKDYRGRGFGRRLLPRDVTWLVFPTIDGNDFLRACGKHPRLRPFAAFDVMESMKRGVAA